MEEGTSYRSAYCRGTVNKLLGGVQAIASWARDNGLIGDDMPWADPFADMRLGEDEPDREPWETEDLVKLWLLRSSLRRKAEGGGGEAAYWLPLLGMFTGARLGELAPCGSLTCNRRRHGRSLPCHSGG